MRTALTAKTLGRAFQHDPLRHAHAAKRGDVVRRHRAGIDVRQKAGLFEHAAASGNEVAKRRIVAEPGEILPRGSVPQLRLVAQGEQCFVATGRRAGAGDRQHLLQIKIGRPLGIGELREGAIMTDVPAKLGERNEDFTRV
jgi:hypothetical protein